MLSEIFLLSPLAESTLALQHLFVTQLCHKQSTCYKSQEEDLLYVYFLILRLSRKRVCGQTVTAPVSWLTSLPEPLKYLFILHAFYRSLLICEVLTPSSNFACPLVNKSRPPQ